MLSAWAVTAAASALAALFVARENLAVRAAREADAARQRLQAEVELATLALARDAQGAVRLTPSGAIITCGDVPAALLAAMSDSANAGSASPGTLGRGSAGPGTFGPGSADPGTLVRGGSADSGTLGRGGSADSGSASPLGRAVSTLLLRGQEFRQPITFLGQAAVVVGALEGGHPTLFIEPPARATLAAAEGGIALRLQQLLGALPHPAWLATEAGDRVWANGAYAKAVRGELGDVAAVAAEPLLDANAHAQLAAAMHKGVANERVQTVVGGERRILEVTADDRDGTVAALAIDVTDTAQALSVQARTLESHAATFDSLATAIAIYGPDRRLAFHNAAFEHFWELPHSLLETAPQEERILDHLRSERRLPETADFRSWKREQLKIYETRERFERWWHLPDGQTLRVIANPGPDGGVTYIYENVTEQLALETRYNALARVQAETIDNLGEGIASFGPDGLLRLANPAFWSLTGVAPGELGDHVRLIAARARTGDFAWSELARRVTGLTDHRTEAKGRIERAGGRILDYAFSPLPDGSTLATVADVTDSVNVARALTDRNAALIEADRLKNAFIEHVSYELRSPLNTIIGFTQLLARPETGELNDRQREYASYISTSSDALLVLIDGILDLASIDAGIMELSVAPVDVREAVRHALDALKDRIVEAALDVRVAIADDAHSFAGDTTRVRQILFNLVSNAVSHSPQGDCIDVSARRDGEFVALSVRDRGPGIAAAKAEVVFDRFHTSSRPGRRGGVGLGLSLVKSFVELHGGSVSVAPVDGPGAELVVRFPRLAAAARRPQFAVATAA